MRTVIKYFFVLSFLTASSFINGQENKIEISKDDGASPSIDVCLSYSALDEDKNEVNFYKGPERNSNSTVKMKILKNLDKSTCLFTFDSTRAISNPYVFYIKNFSRLYHVNIEAKVQNAKPIWATLKNSDDEWKKVSILHKDNIKEIMLHFYDSGYFILDGVVNSVSLEPDPDTCYSRCDFSYKFGSDNCVDERYWIRSGTEPSCDSNSVLLISRNDNTKSEIQSAYDFRFGQLEIIADGSYWAADTTGDTTCRKTDTSIGFETWIDSLHYGILVTNGSFGVLKSVTDTTNKIIPKPKTKSDPLFQEFIKIPYWDNIRENKKNKFIIIWKPEYVCLKINGSDSFDVYIPIKSISIPILPMKIRLNCNVHQDKIPKDSLVQYDALRVYDVNYRHVICDSCTNIDDFYSEQIPGELNIYQNYPNPFNPTTIISYSIPGKSFITIKIYDILGREVVTLVSEEKTAGNHKLNFNAYGLSSGIYFYQIRSNEYVQTKKMILLR